MKAMLCEKFGPPEDLVLKESFGSDPLTGQVRIATEACGVNFPDTLIIENKYQFKPDSAFCTGRRGHRELWMQLAMECLKICLGNL